MKKIRVCKQCFLGDVAKFLSGQEEDGLEDGIKRLIFLNAVAGPEWRKQDDYSGPWNESALRAPHKVLWVMCLPCKKMAAQKRAAKKRKGVE